MCAKNITHSATCAYPAERDYKALQTGREGEVERKREREKEKQRRRERKMKEKKKERSYLSEKAVWLISPG